MKTLRPRKKTRDVEYRLPAAVERCQEEFKRESVPEMERVDSLKSRVSEQNMCAID